MGQYEHVVTDEWAKETLMAVAMGDERISGLHHRQAYAHFRFGELRYLFNGDAGRAHWPAVDQAAFCLEMLAFHEEDKKATAIRNAYHNWKASVRELLSVPTVGADSSET